MGRFAGLLILASLASAAFACNAVGEQRAATSRERIIKCEADTTVQCLCGNGTAGKRLCDEDQTLGPCMSRGRQCTTTEDEEALTPTQAPPLTPPKPKEKPAPEADAGAPPKPGVDAGTPAPSGCIAEIEPNNLEADADYLTTTRCGSLTATDEDLYWVHAAAGETLEVSLAATGNADIVMWEDTAAKTLVTNTTPTRIVKTASASTDYLISVLSGTGQVQSYTLRLQRR